MPSGEIPDHKKTALKIKSLQEELDSLQDDLVSSKETIKKLKSLNNEAAAEAERLEQRIRSLIREKHVEEDKREECVRQLNAAKRGKELQDSEVQQLRAMIERLQHDLLDRDGKIVGLSRDLRKQD